MSVGGAGSWFWTCVQIRKHAASFSQFRCPHLPTPPHVSPHLQVRGKDVPKPIRAWTQAGLSGKLLDLLKKSGFDRPLAIQAQALPIIMSGRWVRWGVGKLISGPVAYSRRFASASSTRTVDT